MKKVLAGMDLHSNNVVIGVMDMDGKRLASRKVPCDLKEVVRCLAPFKKRLDTVAVESTYNWYWLVDGLQALGYPVVLANPRWRSDKLIRVWPDKLAPAASAPGSSFLFPSSGCGG